MEPEQSLVPPPADGAWRTRVVNDERHVGRSADESIGGKGELPDVSTIRVGEAACRDVLSVYEEIDLEWIVGADADLADREGESRIVACTVKGNCEQRAGTLRPGPPVVWKGPTVSEPRW